MIKVDVSDYFYTVRDTIYLMVHHCQYAVDHGWSKN